MKQKSLGKDLKEIRARKTNYEHTLETLQIAPKHNYINHLTMKKATLLRHSYSSHVSRVETSNTTRQWDTLRQNGKHKIMGHSETKWET